jgi:hypothetical protein
MLQDLLSHEGWDEIVKLIGVEVKRLKSEIFRMDYSEPGAAVTAAKHAAAYRELETIIATIYREAGEERPKSIHDLFQ